MLIIQLTYGVMQNIHNSDYLRQEAYNYLGELLHMHVLLLPNFTYCTYWVLIIMFW